MPRTSTFSRCASLSTPHAVTSSPLLDFLFPNGQHALRPGKKRSAQRPHRRSFSSTISRPRLPIETVQSLFFSTLHRASTCLQHQSPAASVPYISKRHESNLSSPRKDEGEWGHEFYIEIVPRSELEAQKALNGQPDPGGTKPAGGFFDSHFVKAFAAGSRLPEDFFIDVNNFQSKVDELHHAEEASLPQEGEGQATTENPEVHALGAQVKLLESIRQLELKLAKAKSELRKSTKSEAAVPAKDGEAMTLTKEDYKGLVDLYYYTHRRRLGPDAPDQSPTPVLLEDYTFKLSEEFAPPDAFSKYYIDEPGYESPLSKVEEALKSRQIREINVMKAFVDILLDDECSNATLYAVYQKLPSPGVAYLPPGLIRLLLQRMSTPWASSEKSMVRYLSLIDDMQKAKLPISRSEWSSAIYLAGRSFSRVTAVDMKNAFRVWRQMEQEAGVKSSHVTFNILFDIAVRAGKYPIAQSLLKEMHDRGLRLNRLGRVSLIYYHGLRGDGDSVRKAYRDFVDAGEIVDTLVLNCVIASLLNAQECTAAEQIYERMKDLQQRFKLKQRPDGSATLYMQYPRGGYATTIDRDIASNSLGRILAKATNLKARLPEHHADLQSAMPLTPDHHTFRSMISYHANVSGNLDRLTVLLNEMTQTFNLPFRSIHFQLLFKGFALHGRLEDPDCTWGFDRLDRTWDACRNAIKEAEAVRRSAKNGAITPTPTLHTMRDVEQAGPKSNELILPNLPQRKKFSTWDEFVIDLAVFPRQRRKDIERVHAQLFDEEVNASIFQTHFFPQQSVPPPATKETYYPLGLGHVKIDEEEGEYTLPSPAKSIAPEDPNEASETEQTHDDIREQQGKQREDEDDRRPLGDEIRATRSLICWLLRAYTRCSGDRAKLEEIWNSARKLWRPSDEVEREGVYRVLRRCLRDCDRYYGR